MKKILFLLLTLSFVLSSGLYAKEEVKKATVFNPITGERKAVVVGDPDVFKGGFILEIAEGYELRDENSEELGFSVITSYKTTLSASMTSVQTTVPASSMTTKDGETINMGMIGSKVFLTLEPGGNKEEIVMCTGISASTWTGCTRGLAFYGTSTAAVVANRKTHSAGSVLIMSNVHYVYDELVDKDQAETIAGVKTFSSYPKIETYAAPTVNEQFAPKKYVDDTISAGAPDANETIKGLVELATGVEIASTTSSGSEARLAIPSSLATSSPDVRGLYVPVSKNDGYLDQGWLDLSENFTFTGENSFSATTTMATTTIVGDLTVESSTTTFSGTIIGAGFNNIKVYTSSGTWTKPAGVTKIKVQVVGGGGGGGSDTTYEGGKGGGGGGGYSMEIIDVTATSSVDYIVGAGGGAAVSGGASSFGQYLSATGGTNGHSPNGVFITKGGAGGTGSGGDLNSRGNGGGAGGYGSGTSVNTGGSGGGSYFGGGASGVVSPSSGDAGYAYGGGGGGCASNTSGGCTGGAGAAGVIIIEY